MGYIVCYEVSLQLTFNFDMIAQFLAGFTSEDFKNVCFGIASLVAASERKSV